MYSLGEKLVAKYPEESREERQTRIDKALDKEHRRGFVGIRLQHENMKLMQLSKRVGKNPKLNASFSFPNENVLETLKE